MDHAKKLVLVDPRMTRPSMKDKTLSNLDTIISETLNSEMSDDEKAKRYAMALRSFKYYDAPPAPAKDEKESEILSSIDPSVQYKAKRLLDQLKRNPDVDWSGKGELIYKQSLIPNSNVVDLLSDVLKKKSTELPTGWKQFAASLKETNAPRELISNTDRWMYMYKTEDDPVEKSKRILKKVIVTKKQIELPRKSKRARKQVQDWIEY